MAEEGEKGIVVQDEDEGDGEVERIPVQVLDDQKTGLAPVSFLREGSDRATGRRAEERSIVRLAVVVAGGPERARKDQDQESGRCRQERRPPAGPEAEPGMLERGGAGNGRVDEQDRRVERRQVRVEVIVRPLQG